MKRKHDDEMVQTAVRLPQSLRDRLSKAGGDRGLGEEIRARLEASFEAEKVPLDWKMREIFEAIASCAAEAARDYGSWSEDAFAFEVLRGCVNMLLTQYQPRGEVVPHPDPGGMADIIFGKEYAPKPEELSRIYVGYWISKKAERGDKEKRR
jgi:hypothetical protein